MANPSKPKVSLGECIALRPTEEEAQIIWEAVREVGLEENGQGVLQLLMLFLTGEEEHVSRNPVFQYFKEHPEELQAMKETAVKGLGALVNRFLKPKR